MLMVLSPALGAVALLILLSMGRPVLFPHPRVGRYGVPFTILKFRTMIPGAEAIGGGYMPDHLDLIPPLGRFLRRTSLDELPQLVNILRGEMSFVGPRPSVVEHFPRYTKSQRRRVEVPPGVTGLAQVTFRNNATWSKRIDLDIQYVDRMCLSLDLKIFVRTIARVFKADNVRLDQSRGDVDDLLPTESEDGKER